MTANPTIATTEELLALYDNFREMKHDINNTLAVIMALSELAARNPAHYEKLAKAVLSRGPEVVSALQNFQNLLGAKLGVAGANAPMSGVFEPLSDEEKNG